MSQAVVTDYFTRRRRRDIIQASKHKLAETAAQNENTSKLKSKKDEVSAKETKKKTKETKQAKPNTRVTRASKRNQKKSASKPIEEYMSPKQETTNSSNSAQQSSTKTSEETLKQTLPLSPSKRTLSDDPDFQNAGTQEQGSPKKKNKLDADSTDTEAVVITNNKAIKATKNVRKRLVLKDTEEKNVDDTESDDVAKRIEEENVPPRMASLRSRTRRGDVANAVNLAEKLLAKKKESKEAIQNSLKTKSNLKDLQDTLMKMKDAKKKAKASKSTKAKSEKVLSQDDKPAEDVKKRDYAYSRFHTLAQEIPKGLTLPFKYKILQEMFRSTDTVISMLFNRQETATWMKVQHSVKEMISRNFERKDLGQIKHVFPEAYLYRQEKGIPTYSDHVKSSDYQLTLEPILDSEEAELFENQPKKLTSGMLVKRRQHFHLQLLDIVKNHHKVFLSTLEPAVEVDNNKLRRWHPQFPVDQVPDIPLSDLPLPPDHDLKKCYSAKEVLDKAKDRLTKKAVDALKKVAEKCVKTPDKAKGAVGEENNNNESPVNKTPPKPAIKGVSKALLDKIREKEADKKLRLMMRSDEEDQRLERLKQLPDVAKALRMLFITEKKGALPLDYVAFKLITACPSVCTAASSDGYVRLMAKESKLLITITSIRKQEYVKLDKGVELNDVFAEINNRIKIAEKS